VLSNLTSISKVGRLLEYLRRTARPANELRQSSFTPAGAEGIESKDNCETTPEPALFAWGTSPTSNMA